MKDYGDRFDFLREEMPAGNARLEGRAMPTDGFSYGGSTALPRVMNNFIHDFCTGLWFACLLVLWVVESRSAGVPAEAAAVLASASVAVFWLMALSLGELRSRGRAPALLASRNRAGHVVGQAACLIAKHVAFVVVFGLARCGPHSSHSAS